MSKSCSLPSYPPSGLGRWGRALLLVAATQAWSAQANEPAHAPAAEPAAHGSAPAAPMAAKPKPVLLAKSSVERDAEKVTEVLHSALERAATRQRTQEQVASAGTRPAAHFVAREAGHGKADVGTARQAAVQGHADVHWSYEGQETGPEAWAGLKPEFDKCASGKRQSPIHIQDNVTLQGPAEALQLDYRPSGGSVVNNGHTIQVDLESGNSMTVRGRRYELVQFHFHHPAEEKVNFKGFAMVVHLVHRDAEGGLAVLAVLLDPGASSSLISKVWTHMPLDTGDRVRLPAGLIDVSELLPKDQQYYQFMGSLTTPPCSEGVLWMVLQQPVTLSNEQLRLFARLFPNNARPTQPLYGRVVRQGTH